MSKQQDTTQTPSFSWFRGNFFPIHFSELRKFIPMALMMLFILFNYTILRNVKDSLVVNAKGSDAEIIPFLKLWGTMPAAIIFTIFYAKISDLFTKENIFYLCTGVFLAFFAAFAFIIYPNIDLLHPNPEYIATLKQQLPNFKWFIVMGGNWSFAIFYIAAELWGSIMIGLLFWQFANQIVKRNQTKRFYPLFGLVGNIGLVFSGFAVQYFSKTQALTTSQQDPWQITLYYLMSCIVISGLIIMGLYYWTNRIVEKEPKDEETAAPVKKVKKKKPSIVESFRYIFSSKHLLCICFIVFAYGVTINYVDVLWKGQVKLFFQGDYNAFAAYMGQFSKTTGMIAIPFMLLGGIILRKLSWFKAASITPTILFITGLGFFSVILAGAYHGDTQAPAFAIGGYTCTFLSLAVQFGFWQNALTKATKYSLFDSTKEISYRPLDEDLKTKGKAAVDVVGSRLGKSGGAFTFFILNTLLPGVANVKFVPFLAAITLGVTLIWFVALKVLDGSIYELTYGKKENASEKPEKEAA